MLSLARRTAVRVRGARIPAPEAGRQGGDLREGVADREQHGPRHPVPRQGHGHCRERERGAGRGRPGRGAPPQQAERGGAAAGRRRGASQSGQGGQVVGGRRGEPRQRCEVRGGGCQSLCGQAQAEAD